MVGLTFKNLDQENVKDYAAKHLEEMKKFNEQLSTITGELKLTQMSLQIDDYINKINDHKISIVDDLCELTSKKLKLKILMRLMPWLK